MVSSLYNSLCQSSEIDFRIPVIYHKSARDVLSTYLQLFRERLSEKVHATIRKVLWVVFSSLFFKEISKNVTRGYARMFASARGK